MFFNQFIAVAVKQPTLHIFIGFCVSKITTARPCIFEHNIISIAVYPASPYTSASPYTPAFAVYPSIAGYLSVAVYLSVAGYLSIAVYPSIAVCLRVQPYILSVAGYRQYRDTQASPDTLALPDTQARRIDLNFSPQRHPPTPPFQFH